MFVQNIFRWTSPQNKSDELDSCSERSHELDSCSETTYELDNCSETTYEDAKEELFTDNPDSQTQQNIDDSLLVAKHHKKKVIMSYLEPKDTQNIYDKEVGASGDCDGKLWGEPKNQEKTISTSYNDITDTQNIYDKEVGPCGDCCTELQREPMYHQTKFKNPVDSSIASENKFTKRYIFTQTENKKGQRKVSFKAHVIRKSSSESMIDKTNTMVDYDRHSLPNRSPKSVTFGQNEYIDHNTVTTLPIKTDFSNETQKCDDTFYNTKEVPHKSPTIGNSRSSSSISKLQRFSRGNASQDGVIRSTEPVDQCYYKKFDSKIYGELLVLGCDDSSSRNRFVLRRRQKASGVKEMSSEIYDPPIPVTNHTVKFQLSDSKCVLVEYVRDTTTDMFQIGRYEHWPVDIHLANISNGSKRASRFACRIVIKRQGHPREARLYAAAFDESGNIFLGEEAIANVRPGGEIDGFTTNGVHILHPGGEWREVSVRGKLYMARVLGEASSSRRPIYEEVNLLQDGTLIDLCGVTLLWRTHKGLSRVPTEDNLDRMESILRELAPESQRRNGPLTGDLHWEENQRQAFVFLSCGHVVSMSLGLKDSSMDGWACPECRCIGPVQCLRVGRQRGFYADKDLLSHAFRPCGHVATLKTVKFWSSLPMPPHKNTSDKGVCPFCATKLYRLAKYVCLIYPERSSL